MPQRNEARSEQRKATSAPNSSETPQAPDGDLRHERGALLGLAPPAGFRPQANQLAQSLGLEHARADRVDQDPVGSDLARERLEPGGQARAQRVREREPRDRLAHGGRGHGHDPAVTLSAHPGQDLAHGAHRRLQGQLEGRVEGFIGQLGRVPRRWPSGVRHQDVQRPEALARLVQVTGQGRAIGDVEPCAEDALTVLALELGHGAGQPAGIAPADRYTGALGEQRLGGRQAEAIRRGQHHRPAFPESEIHGSSLWLLPTPRAPTPRGATKRKAAPPTGATPPRPFTLSIETTGRP